jgi:arsenate reductase
MEASRSILFLCPHNAAKSVIAAAYWNRLAAARGLAVEGISAGTEPSPAVSPAVAAGLMAEGIDVSTHQPRTPTSAELAGAWRVVSMNCDLDGLVPTGVPVDRWDDVPAASEDLAACQAAILDRVEQLATGVH